MQENSVRKIKRVQNSCIPYQYAQAGTARDKVIILKFLYTVFMDSKNYQF
jgi:hypothetical protein